MPVADHPPLQNIQKQETTPADMEPQRLPGLDGLRGLAILLVIALHSAWFHIFPKRIGDALYRFTSPLGLFGVPIFFVLSGFLITHLLLQAERRHGSINLQHFWLKRFIRIGPPIVAYVAFICTYAWWRGITLSRMDIASILLFFRDLISGSPMTDHFWSLAIEAQFYLFWPLMLIIAPAGERLKMGCILLLAFPIIRLLGTLCLTRESFYFFTSFLRFDFILAGCLLALSYPKWITLTLAYQQVVRLRLIGVFLCITTVILTVQTDVPCMERGMYSPSKQLFAEFQTITGYSGVSLLLVSLLLNSGKVRSLFHTRVFTAAGLISYSLYVWQQFFMFAPGLPAWMGIFCVKLPITFLAGWISYRLLEKPFNGIRKSLTV